MPLRTHTVATARASAGKLVVLLFLFACNTSTSSAVTAAAAADVLLTCCIAFILTVLLIRMAFIAGLCLCAAVVECVSAAAVCAAGFAALRTPQCNECEASVFCK